MEGHGKTLLRTTTHIRDPKNGPRPKVPAQVRPPERNTTPSRQDAPNRKKRHGKKDTNQNNKQNSDRDAKSDTNKVFSIRVHAMDHNGNIKSTESDTHDQNQHTQALQQHTRSTLNKTEDTELIPNEQKRDASPRRNVEASGAAEPAEPQRHKEEGAGTERNNNNNKNTTFVLSKNCNINRPSKKEREINPCRNVDITAQTNERKTVEAIKTAAPL